MTEEKEWWEIPHGPYECYYCKIKEGIIWCEACGMYHCADLDACGSYYNDE